MRRTAELAIPGQALWLKAGRSPLSVRKTSIVTLATFPSESVTSVGIAPENSSLKLSIPSATKRFSFAASPMTRVTSCAVIPG
jgi:hypothetical protein